MTFPDLPLQAPTHREVSCTYTSKGPNYERNVRFHFHLLQNEMVTLREKRNGLDVRQKCRVILSLLVVNVSYLGCSCAWDTLLQKENKENVICFSTIGKIVLSLHARLACKYQVLEGCP